MQHFNEIVTAHAHVDSTLASQLAAAATARERKRLEQTRKINDESFFVLLFAQFENEVNERAKRFIQRENAANHWADQREWDKYRGDAIRRIPFLIRCGFLTQPNQPNYHDIVQLYEVRNQIAHRGMAETNVLIPQVAADLRAIVQRLH